LFSSYDIERVTGKPFSDISLTEHYRSFVDNSKIRKKKISARVFFQTLAEIQFESGYPYILFEDTVNRANPIVGRISMSNLCTEIL
ncbi:MAG: ribonucleotide-diphosphate reductase subunit alpha, partial [Bartonella sp.]|nr:ribonucleotide-diphosphate reductase subunit alpha [Bartonella sp.]